MPWTLPHNPKSPLTEAFAWFLSRWAKRLSWKETAEAFHTTWDAVYQSVAMAVSWGREHMNTAGVLSIGIDEIALKKGHTYITLVYQIDEHCKRLLWIGQDRTKETLHGFFDWLGTEKSKKLQFVASDMWKA
ncbi:MAG: ISL3 family transposase [Leptospirillia bacterium]